MRLHVLTACTRPENLSEVAASLSEASCGYWEVCWHVRFDPEHWHVGGQQLKNDMLDQITDGWVCFLDDDTTLDPDFPRLAGTLREKGGEGLVVSQQRADGRTLHAAVENVRVGEIDIGQVMIDRALIGDARIPLHYDGDGMFLSEVLAQNSLVLFHDEVLSHHNRLNMVAV